MNRPSADPANRAAALNANESFIVEAPAGSGKTSLLILRLLKLLATADEPEEVVAITFTRKATAQMRDKVLLRLRQMKEHETLRLERLEESNELERLLNSLARQVLHRDAERGWNLCDQPERLRIATIDSFSAEIAARVPLMARLGSTLTPTERPEALYRNAARKTMERLVDASPLGAAVKTLLAEHDNDLQRCVASIESMLSCRTRWKMLLGDDGSLQNLAQERQLREALEAAPRHAITEQLRILRDHLDDSDCRRLHDLLRFRNLSKPGSEQNRSEQDPDRPHEQGFSAECAECWRHIANMVLKDQKQPAWYSRISKTQGFPAHTPEHKELSAFLQRHTDNDKLLDCLGAIRTMPTLAYSEEQWQLVMAYTRVLRHAVAELKVTFAENNAVDFSEVALAAVQALDNPEAETDIAAAFGTQIRHILIDELQDTSAVQYELLKALTAGWDGVSQTVFAVGDPKQSIYGFRDAEVQLFRTMQSHGLGRLRLTNLRLSFNFRSQKRLVERWNKGFAAVFIQKRLEDIPFSPATATRPSISDLDMRVHACILADNTPEAWADAERSQAREISALVATRIAAHQGAAPPKIAVLARARTHLPVLLDEFRERDIRYRAVEIDVLEDLQEVRDVVALTRCLLHPADRIAWLSVLRAPWCGLTLADLHALCQGDEHATRTACIGELIEGDFSSLTPDGRARCTRVGNILRTALDARNRISTATLVERTWHSLGGPACTTPQQQRNTETYFQFLREAERENALNDFRILEERLERFFAQPQIFEDGAPVVDVMTIHAAKGLEWDIVIIPELQRKGAADSSRLLNWIDYPALPLGVVLAPRGASEPSEDSFYRWFCRLQKERDEAERKRLFYVACTRAADELHVFGTLPLNSKGECSTPHSESLLCTAWPMVKRDFIDKANRMRKAATSAIQNVIPFPSASETVPGVIPALAATAADVVQLNQRRLPTGWRPPVASEPLLWQRAAVPLHTPDSATYFARAEGSILARTTGDAIHRFLEQIARDLAAGASLSDMKSRITAKSIIAVVRSLGVSPDAQKAVASDITNAINRTLEDPIAHWLLGQRTSAMTESAISAAAPGASRNVRIDRAFLAGESPGSNGEDTLWLVDYKTSANGHGDIDQFLMEQQQFYSEQLTIYARLLRPLFPQARNVKLGLYFPSLGKLQHWDWMAEVPRQ